MGVAGGHELHNTRGTSMNKYIFRVTASILIILLSACTGNDPGPLEGKWKMSGLIPMTIIFRSGETEAMGMIEKVSYKNEGNDVLVTYKEGMSQGMTMRYTIIGPNSVRTELGTLRRIR